MSDAIEARLRRVNDELLIVGNDYSDVLLDAASGIETLRERHESFVRKVRGEAQRAEDLATCTSLTSYLANEILALCDAELGKEGK